MFYNIIVDFKNPIWTSPKSKTHFWQISTNHPTVSLYLRCHHFILHDIYIFNGLSAIAAWSEARVHQPSNHCGLSLNFSRKYQCQQDESRLGVGVTKPIFFVPLFSTFSVIVKTNVSYWIPRLYLAGVAPAQLRWHLTKMNVIQGI